MVRHARSRAVLLLVLAAAVTGGAAWMLLSDGAAGPGSGKLIVVPRPSSSDGLDRSPEGERPASPALVICRPSAPGTGAYSAPAGRRMTFGIAARLETRFRDPDSGVRPGMTIALDGQLMIAVAGRRRNEVLADVAFPTLRARAKTDGHEVAYTLVEEDLKLTTRLLLRDDGSLVGVRFDSGARPPARDLLLGILAALRIVVPEGNPDAWTAEETDTTGPFAADYRVLSREGGRIGIEKAKRAYRVQAPAPAVDVRSTTLATLDTGLGWLAEVRFTESMTMKAPDAGLLVENDGVIELRLLGSEDGDPSVFRELAWEGPWPTPAEALAEGDAAADAAAAEAAKAAALKGIAGLDPAHVVEDLFAEIARGAGDGERFQELRDRLLDFLRTDPGLIARLGPMLLGRGDATCQLLTVAGCADTPEVEAFLRDVAGDPAGETRVRQYAVLGLLARSALDADSIAALRNLTLDPAAPAGLRRTGMLATGAAAGRAGGPESAAAVLSDLLAQESAATARGELATWLEALGNAGTESVLPAARRHLAHEDPQVRVSAASALRKVGGEEALWLLAETAARDADASVRAMAARALGARADDRALAAAGRLLADPSVHVQLAAVHGLEIQARRSAAARELLADAARSGISNDVRRAANGVLERMAGG